jgi:hypothetical protein
MEYQASQIEYQEQYQSMAEEQYQSQSQDGPETAMMEGEGAAQGGSGDYYDEKQQD